MSRTRRRNPARGAPERAPGPAGDGGPRDGDPGQPVAADTGSRAAGRGSDAPWSSTKVCSSNGSRPTAVAIGMAASPAVLDALDDPDPTAVLQPYAERVRREAGLDFITIMNTDGRRYTHPNPRQIGGYFLGHIGPALAGRTFTETYTGTLGPSVRAVTPVRDATGRIRALVSAGITVEKISAQMRRQLATTTLTGAIGLITGTVGTYLVSTRLRRQTHGLRSAELRRMYEYHQAILHAVREGLLLVDEHGRLTLANDAPATCSACPRTRRAGT